MRTARNMDFFQVLFLIAFSVLSSSAKHDHAVPTYFGRVDENGKLINRNSPDYGSDIKLPYVNKIYRVDAETALLDAKPTTVENGGKLTISWQGVMNATAKDFIAFYCPTYDDAGHHLDYFTVDSSSTWAKGNGNRTLTVYNMRTTCAFRYYRAGRGSSQLVATSNEVSFANGGPYAPLQGHLAMTENPTEMRVMWNSAEVNQPPVVQYGLTKDITMAEYEVVVHEYTADSMCEAPATGNSFWHPGFTYDILLKNLQGNTRYYYSFGSEGNMSPVKHFTTPLAAGNSTPYKFIIYGDMGVDPVPEAVTTAELVLNEVENNDIRFIYHHGDISYARGYAYIWEQWFKLIEPYSTLVPYMIGIGNHEYDHLHGGIGKDPSLVTSDAGFRPSWWDGNTDSGGECGIPMFKRFHMPDNGNSVFWYSYDYGLAHIVMMSSEHDYSPGSPQYEWMAADLTKVDRKKTPWVLLGGHRAMYCSALIPGDYVVAINMQRLFEDLLYQHKVDIAFWAHYHSYERTCKLYKNECVDDGVLHLVVGSGGKGADPNLYYNKTWSKYHIADYGYGRVTIANASALLFEWIQNRSNKILDYIWLTK